MPIEFMFGRQLSPEELELIREQIESMDEITAIDDEVHGIVERNWRCNRADIAGSARPLAISQNAVDAAPPSAISSRSSYVKSGQRAGAASLIELLKSKSGW